MDGIYRVSGNLATIQKLRFMVDQGWCENFHCCSQMSSRTSRLLLFSEEQLDLDHSQWEDIHVVTGALKMFFRELPEPLFPFRFFPLFVDAMSKSRQTNPAAAGAPPSHCTCVFEQRSKTPSANCKQ